MCFIYFLCGFFVVLFFSWFMQMCFKKTTIKNVSVGGIAQIWSRSVGPIWQATNIFASTSRKTFGKRQALRSVLYTQNYILDKQHLSPIYQFCQGDFKEITIIHINLPRQFAAIFLCLDWQNLSFSNFPEWAMNVRLVGRRPTGPTN